MIGMITSSLIRIIQDYIEAVNILNIAGILSVLHEDIVIKNYSNGKESLIIKGKSDFQKQTERSGILRLSRQKATSFRMKDDWVEVEIDHAEDFAIDFCNSEDKIKMKGKYIFQFKSNKIILIENHHYNKFH